MKKRKQILSVLLATAMAVPMLVGCGSEQGASKESSAAGSGKEMESVQVSTNEQETSSDAVDESSGRISEETIELTIVAPTNVSADQISECVQFTEYEKRLGIKLIPSTIPNDAWSSKLTLLMASGELPDIIAKAGMVKTDLIKYGMEGYFLDLSKYLDIMPNLSRIIEENPEYAKHITMENGAIYGVAPFSEVIESALMHEIWMSETWLNNVGMDAPKTLDELYNVLKAFKEKDANANGDAGDEIPMYFSKDYYYTILPILWAHGVYSADYTFHLQADESGNIQLMNVTENFRDYLRYMKKLYAEGLINEDAFVVAKTESRQVINDGKVGYVGSITDMFTNSGYEGDYSKQKWFGVTGFIGTEYSDNSVFVRKTRINPKFKAMISADTEYPEECAKLIDYMFTIEGAISSTNGYEGVSFDFADIEGYSVIDRTNYADGYESTEKYRMNKATASGFFNIYSINEGTIYDMLSEIETEKLMEGRCLEVATANAEKERTWRNAVEAGVEFVDVLSELSYGDDTSERATLYTDIVNYCATSNVQFITGEKDIEKDWAGYLAELEKIGLQRYMEIEQAAYDRYAGK